MLGRQGVASLGTNVAPTALRAASDAGAAFDGVPMSEDDTADHQARRLTELGLRTAEVRTLRDIDHWDDAVDIASTHPHLRVAAAVRRVLPSVS